jgi:hypothetical protein
MYVAVNYLAVLICAIASIVVGSIWYGPLFGKKYMKIMGADNMTPEQKEAMKKRMWGMYFLQLVLSFITSYILSYTVASWAGPENIITVSILMWLGFILPTVAGGSLWGDKPKNLAWSLFFITAGAQFVTFIVFGFIISAFTV